MGGAEKRVDVTKGKVMACRTLSADEYLQGHKA